MNLYHNLLAIIIALFAAATIIILKKYFHDKDFSIPHSSMTLVGLLLLTLIIFGGYSYFLYHNVSIAQFYPVVKIIEIVVPIIAGVIFFKTKLNYVNYLGLLLIGIAIFCLEY